MSEKYKSAMDRIVLSDEKKAEIKAAASAKIAENKNKSGRSKFVYVSCATVAAACLAVYIGVAVVQNNTAPISAPSGSEVVSAINPTDETAKTNITEPSGQTNNTMNVPKEEKNQEYAPSTENRTEAAPKSSENELPETKQNDTETEGNFAQEPQQPTVGENSENNYMTAGSGALLSPWEEINDVDIDKIKAEVGYDFSLPSYMPQGYEFDSASLLFGELVQIIYCSGENRILYRTEDCNEDISGDYGTYDLEETVNVGGTQVTLRQNGGKCFSAIWNDGKAHAIAFDEGMEKTEVEKIIESIK